MSITVEYYFRSELSRADLAKQISAPLGCGPTLQDTLLLGTRLTLGRCTEPNDGELEFEAYNYELVLRTRGRPFRATLVPNMLSVVRVLQELFGYAGMLVYDLAILLAKYDEEFVDTLSGTSLADCPVGVEKSRQLGLVRKKQRRLSSQFHEQMSELSCMPPLT